jgi:hypothetical protein
LSDAARIVTLAHPSGVVGEGDSPTARPARGSSADCATQVTARTNWLLAVGISKLLGAVEAADGGFAMLAREKRSPCD